jgi:photosystem II stability/assembly factor-like uncharacterized protein
MGSNGVSGVIGDTGSTGGIGLNGFIGMSGVGLTGMIGPTPYLIKGPTGINGASYEGNTGSFGSGGMTGDVGPTGSEYSPQISDLQTLTSTLSLTGSTTYKNGVMSINGGFDVSPPQFRQGVPLNYPVPTDGVNFGSSYQGLNISASRDGKYVTTCAQGVIKVSSNYGESFVVASFSVSFHAVAVSATGQYQCCISTGVPQCTIFMSSNYGTSWVQTNLATSAYNKWYGSVSISPSGKYVYCGGGGGFGILSRFSKDFGVTFTTGGGALNRMSSSMVNSGIAVSVTPSFKFYVANISLATATETNAGTRGISVGVHSVSVSPDAFEYVAIGPGFLIHNTTLAGSVTSLLLKSTPENFSQVIFCTSKIWASGVNSLYTSIDLGVTWDKIFTLDSGGIRSFHVTPNNAFVYILTTNGDIVRQFRSSAQSLFPVGYMVQTAPITTTRFTTFGTTINTCNLTLDVGVWSVSFGFKMASDGVNGLSTQKNIKYGLSKTTQNDYFYSKYLKPYSINNTDTSTWQSFNENVVIYNPTISVIDLTAQLQNTPSSGLTNTFLTEYFISAVLINDTKLL